MLKPSGTGLGTKEGRRPVGGNREQWRLRITDHRPPTLTQLQLAHIMWECGPRSARASSSKSERCIVLFFFFLILIPKYIFNSPLSPVEI